MLFTVLSEVSDFKSMRELLLEVHSKLAMHVTKKHLSDIQEKSVDTQQERAGGCLER